MRVENQTKKMSVVALVIPCISLVLGGCGSGNSPAPSPPPLQKVNAENCFLIDASPSTNGCEDVVTYTESGLITGQVDVITLWGDDINDGDPVNAKPGELNFVNASDSEAPTLTRMSRTNFPDGVRFYPHGMYYLPEGNLLHVINHAYDMGGERIDVFRIVPGANGGTPEAQWQYAWTNDFITQRANGVLNDLAVVDADHLFVTRFLYSDPDTGRPAGSFTRHWNDYLENGTKETEFYYCTRDAASDSSDCVVADTGFGLANGINFGNDDKTLLYVSDVYAQELRAYTVDKDNNNAVTSRGALSLDHRADNIEWNTFHQRLFLGSVAGDISELGWGGVWGGADELIPDQDNPTSTADLTTRVLDDGSTLLGVSGANYANGNMYMGSYFAAGVMVCPTTITTQSRVVV